MKEKLQKIIAVLFGGVFGIICFISATYMNHYKAKSWIPVETTVIDYGVKTSRSGAGTLIANNDSRFFVVSCKLLIHLLFAPFFLRSTGPPEAVSTL